MSCSLASEGVAVSEDGETEYATVPRISGQVLCYNVLRGKRAKKRGLSYLSCLLKRMCESRKPKAKHLT